MDKVYEAVMHCTPDEPEKVNQLATKVVEKWALNSADLPAADPPLTGAGSIEESNDLLTPLIPAAEGNHDKKDQRDAKALVVFNLLQSELLTLNKAVKAVPVLADQLVLIDKSGFDASKQPVDHDVPPVPVIDRIEDGKIPHSAKVFLVQKKGRNLRYTGQMSLTNVEADFKNVPGLEGVNRHELVVTGLTKAVEVYLRFRAEDGSKKSAYCDAKPFLPR